MSADPARAALDAQVLAWMRETEWCEDDARFDRLARALWAFQVEHCEPYRRFCRGRGLEADEPGSWRDIPTVPTGAFKEMPLRSFPASRQIHTFRTSGTATKRRGELHLDTLSIYEASLLPTLRRFLFPELPETQRTCIRVLAPSPSEAPDSSLSHMFGCTLDALGDAISGFDFEAGRLALEPLLAALESACGAGEPVALCGTAFAFVHLLERLAERGVRLSLPEGSRAMETGGFKGRGREQSATNLYAEIESALGIPPRRIVNQYGMTELGSQFYDTVLRDPAGPRRKQGPPWARVRVIDPETGEAAAPGAIGAISIVDLANTGSVLAVQTADLGRRLPDGFEVLGREAGAEARGCSIAADAMLAS